MDTSSNASAASTVVGHRGQIVDLEKVIDETVGSLQGHLNMVQCRLREIALFVENDGELQEEVKMTDALDDELREMAWLFEDLRSAGYDLISVPDTADEKAWVKAHKAERKLHEKRVQAEHAAKVKADREKEKALLKAQKDAAQSVLAPVAE